MMFTSTPASRHHNYLCQLIQKMESRFGLQHSVVVSLREQAAHFDAGAPHYLAIRVTRHAEPSISVIQRLWDSRAQKMCRAGNQLSARNANGGADFIQKGGDNVLESVSTATFT